MGNCFQHGDTSVIDRSSRSIESRDRRASETIGLKDFIIKSMIGSGNTSKVFLAQKKTSGRHYAIKIIQKDQVKKQFLTKNSNVDSENSEVKHINTERKLLETLDHPFLIKFYYAFQTGHRLHLILEFANGGDLYGRLMREQRVSENHCRFYAAEIICALEYLHDKDIIFRGLKPEDVLLDSKGHIKLSDFGLAKSVYSQTSTFCGSPLYLAPEIIKGEKQTIAVDYWSLGVLLYEMMVGKPPFWNEDGKQLLDNILHNKFDFPQDLSDEAKDIIKQLLNLIPSQRLGTGPTGIEEIKSHKFFESIDWDTANKKQLKPPFVPLIKKESDIGNIDPVFTKNIIQQYQSFVDNNDVNFSTSTFENYTFVGRITEKELGQSCPAFIEQRN